jgi:large exoprotein involved in heme utilization and adhesion
VRQLNDIRYDPGDGGNITITANRLDIRSGGTVSVSGEGRGRAGSLSVNANAITLNHSNLSAQTERGNRGNIRINGTDLVSLQDGSQITTNATREATGGNIRIDSPLLVARDNSDITANAIRGQGGNIAISSNRVSDLTSQITATSQLGLDGTVRFSGLEANPSQAVTELPELPPDAAQQIVQRCTGTGVANPNTFIVTGRGGLPAGVQDTLSQDQGWWDWRQVEASPQAAQPRQISQIRPLAAPIEAQSWRTNRQGKVELTGATPAASQVTCSPQPSL